MWLSLREAKRQAGRRLGRSVSKAEFILEGYERRLEVRVDLAQGRPFGQKDKRRIEVEQGSLTRWLDRKASPAPPGSPPMASAR